MKQTKVTLHSKRTTMRIDKIRPAAHPDWYKHLRRLSRLASTTFKVKW
jgi:hypothetical protein